jgi:hypothetical protein
VGVDACVRQRERYVDLKSGCLVGVGARMDTHSTTGGAAAVEVGKGIGHSREVASAPAHRNWYYSQTILDRKTKTKFK